MEIRTLTPDDAEGGLRLSTQVGWNHLLTDWHRIIGLAPDSCVGIFDDQLIATCTVLQFGTLGWVGVFLVDLERQRQGLGGKVFNALLTNGHQHGIERFALDSSDVGRPIYKRSGFEEHEGIERWIGSNEQPVGAASAEELGNDDWDSLLFLDRTATKVDRARQLRQLASEEGASIRIIKDPEGVCAYGFSRPGRLAGSIGPVIARTSADARTVIDTLIADRHRLDGNGSIAIDLLDHDGAKAIMTDRGFKSVRRNIRMFKPLTGPRVMTGPNVFAATGLGMG